MPELPEVETVVRGLRKHLTGKRVLSVKAEAKKLREAIPDLSFLTKQQVISVDRRSKYAIIHFLTGDVIIHLGMTGVLSWKQPNSPKEKHEHWVMAFEDGELRLKDPRRFGAILWQEKNTTHPSLSNLGPEPLTDDFNFDDFSKKITGRKTPIKTLIMTPSVVVGVGNIYASEALYLAKIHPKTPGGALKKKRIDALMKSIRSVLTMGIASGGASIRDYQNSDGERGSFSQHMNVYGRQGENCPQCQSKITQEKIGGRSSFWCPHCQPETDFEIVRAGKGPMGTPKEKSKKTKINKITGKK